MLMESKGLRRAGQLLSKMAACTHLFFSSSSRRRPGPSLLFTDSKQKLGPGLRRDDDVSFFKWVQASGLPAGGS